VKFLCSKLEDHYTVSTAALPGLNQLLRMQADGVSLKSENSISRENSLDIIKSIMQNVHVQSMIQSDRNIVFRMCQYVLNSNELSHLVIEENFDTDFVYGFIQAMDGEKDPRNLLVCFECISTLCKKFRLGPFVDETFEVFACYFPIDFTPVICLPFSFLIEFKFSSKYHFNTQAKE
jgi:DNA repair/transcription protein MET18/MMS19